MDNPRRDSLIDYPCAFPIKVMGLKVEGFVHAPSVGSGRSRV